MKNQVCLYLLPNRTFDHFKKGGRIDQGAMQKYNEKKTEKKKMTMAEKKTNDKSLKQYTEN